MTFHQDADSVWRPDAETFAEIQQALSSAAPPPTEGRFETVTALRVFLDEVENEMPQSAAKRLYDAGWRIAGSSDHLVDMVAALVIIAYNTEADSETAVNHEAAMTLAALGIYK